MIPFIAKVGVRNERGRGFRLWMPLIFVWILLLPVLLLLTPLMVIACWIGQVNPLRALSTFWQIICGLKGTDIEVGAGSASFSIDIF